MKRSLKVIFAAFLLLANFVSAHAQLDLTTESWFDQQVGLENVGLINGHEYRYPFRASNSNPFFFAEGGSPGKVLYKNQWFGNIQLMYDLYSHEVVLQHQTKDGQMKLVCFDQSLLGSFIIFDHRFSKIDGQFYDVLFQGTDWALLATRKKTTNVSGNQVEFVEEVKYYIQQGRKIQEYAGKNTFMLLCTNQSALQTFIKQNKIKLGKKREKDFVLICSFIENNCKPGKE